MAKKLVLMNGRWSVGGDHRYHIYVAANSKADAARMLQELAGGYKGWKSEIDNYFSHGCWGNSMDGIEPERGAWVVSDKYGSKPFRVYPKEVAGAL